MIQIQRSAIVKHPAHHMYDLVNDVESYPKFLSGCVSAEVLEANECYMLARMDLHKASVKVSLVTRNTLTKPSKIVMTLSKGPLKSLNGKWTFTCIDDNSCTFGLDLSFELDNSIIRFGASKLLSEVANNLVKAMCNRADKLFGDNGDNR